MEVTHNLAEIFPDEDTNPPNITLIFICSCREGGTLDWFLEHLREEYRE